MNDDLKQLFVEMKGIREDLDKVKATSVTPTVAEGIEERYYDFHGKVLNYLRKISDEMDANENRLDSLEQYSRRNCLLVHGVIESPKEDCTAVLMKLFKEKEITLLNPSEIDRTHRLGVPRGDAKNPRPIIIKFTSYGPRRRVFTNKKKLKGCGITITEQLTTKRMALLKEARTRYGLHNAWSLDGNVFIMFSGIKRKISNTNDFKSFPATSTTTLPALSETTTDTTSRMVTRKRIPK